MISFGTVFRLPVFVFTSESTRFFTKIEIMKLMKIVLAASALVLSVGAYSQKDSTKKDTLVRKMDTTVHKMDTTKKRQDLQEHASGSSLGTSATFSAQTTAPKPNFGRYYIPALGTYNTVVTTTENKSITITGDENNAGKIWVEGIAGTRFYALLKALPGTYKIPAQKTDATAVTEGTLIYDENSKQVNVCTGCGFNDQSPAVTDALISTTASDAKNKKHRQAEKVKKVPGINFIGVKAEQGTVSLLL